MAMNIKMHEYFKTIKAQACVLQMYIFKNAIKAKIGSMLEKIVVLLI